MNKQDLTTIETALKFQLERTEGGYSEYIKKALVVVREMLKENNQDY